MEEKQKYRCINAFRHGFHGLHSQVMNSYTQTRDNPCNPCLNKSGCQGLLYNVFTKRSQSQSSQLEMLFSEWNADNGNAKYNTENQMGKTNPNTS